MIKSAFSLFGTLSHSHVTNGRVSSDLPRRHMSAKVSKKRTWF